MPGPEMINNNASTNQSRGGGGLALAVIAIAQLMIVLDATIVNVALPTIQKQLNFSPTDLQWIINGYAVTFGGLLLLGGRAGDLYGRRRMFTTAIIIFTVASLLGGLAQNEVWLITTRIVQGVGAAIVAPTALSLMADTFPEGPQRNRAFGVYGAIAGGGGALGLLLGGVLTSLESWRWIFFVNIPIGIFVLLLIPRTLKASARRPGHLDLSGGITVTAGIMSLVFGLSRAGTYGWGNDQTVIALSMAAVFLVSFLVIERRHPQPLMPFRIFSNRSRSGAYGVALAIGASIFSVFFFLTLFVQNILGFSPLKAGVSFMPLTIGIIIMAGIMSRIVSRTGARLPMMIGALAAAGGLYWVSHLTPTSSYLSAIFAPMLIMALGLGAIFVPMSLTVVSGVRSEETGLASALLNVSQQIGGSLGLAILVSVATSVTTDQIQHGVPQVLAITSGYSRAFLIASGIALCASLIAFFAIRSRPAREREQIASSSISHPQKG